MAKGQYTDGPQELLSCFITDSGSFSILTSSRALSYPIKVNELNYEITLNVYRVGKCWGKLATCTPLSHARNPIYSFWGSRFLRKYFQNKWSLVRKFIMCIEIVYTNSSSRTNDSLLIDIVSCFRQLWRRMTSYSRYFEIDQVNKQVAVTCGTVDRVVASGSGCLELKSRHWTLYCSKSLLSAVWKDENEENEAVNGPQKMFSDLCIWLEASGARKRWRLHLQCSQDNLKRNFRRQGTLQRWRPTGEK